MISKPFVECMENLADGATVEIRSPGGDSGSGHEVAKLIKQKRLKIRVVDFCKSACVEYIFPASDEIELAPNAIVGLHGNEMADVRVAEQLGYRHITDCRSPLIGAFLADIEELWFDADVSPDSWMQTVDRLEPVGLKTRPIGSAVRNIKWTGANGAACNAETVFVTNIYRHDFWLPTGDQLRDLFGDKVRGKTCADDPQCVFTYARYRNAEGSAIVGDTLFFWDGKAAEGDDIAKSCGPRWSTALGRDVLACDDQDVPLLAARAEERVQSLLATAIKPLPARSWSSIVAEREATAEGVEAAWRSTERAGSCESYDAFLSKFPDSVFAAQAARARGHLCTAPSVAAAPRPASRSMVFVDARKASPATLAPLVAHPAALPDFALFRECDGCPEMVVLPAGSFEMGSPPHEDKRFETEDTQAGHGGRTLRVTLRRFAISRFEVTWDAWSACAAAGVCRDLVSGKGGDEGWGRDRRPVINVSWEDALAYARHLRTVANGADYGLPTEAEWEYAARAGTKTPWSFGGDKDRIGDYAWFAGNAGDRPHPVGEKAANPWGLYDMHGNVWEWTADCWKGDLGATPANGAARTTGRCVSRVIRSSSYQNVAQHLRSVIRNKTYPDASDFNLGFRIARSL